MQPIKNIRIDTLISHEQIDRNKLRLVISDLKKSRMLRHPVVVDKKTLLILDGHHRCQAFRELGIKEIPCYLVDYYDQKIRVHFRRADVKDTLIKEAIINFASQGKLFPCKTTKHQIPNRPSINMSIKKILF